MKYRCSVCGYIYEGDSIPEDFSCPVCHQSADKFAPLEDAAVSEEPVASDKPLDLSYDPLFARTDPACRYMKEIHEMAVSGHSLHSAMSTQMPMPGWDDILLLGAQLNPPPLDDGEEVDTTTVIGKHAKKPMVLESPIYISHMSFGALSKEAKVSLAKGSAMAKTAMCSGEGGILPEEKAAERRREQRELLDRLAADAEDVDLVLLAGDLFDSDASYWETAETLTRVFSAIKAQIFIAPGNHDYYTARSPYASMELPENVHIFRTAQLRGVELPELNARVWGAGFTSAGCEPLLRSFTVRQSGRVELMVLHGDIAQNSRYNAV